ncbi:MAG TPA: glycosyltransferase family 87 protein [Tepidisphaeraceae bacterium]|nr:glycosyltransferase family 87 protein [Tepidisphaeraceae bacterium]
MTGTDSPRAILLRRLFLALFCIIAAVFCFAPIRNQLRGGSTKDYPLWFDTGQRVLHGDSPYYKDRHNEFPFMYPPGASVLLAPITVFGKLPMMIVLVAINTFAWVVCILAPIYLVAGTTRQQPLILYVLPTAVCIVYIWSSYLLGNPPIVLAACVLGMFICLRKRIDWSAGLLLALAAGFKAFPILAVPYLMWRRHWRALGYTVAFLFILLLVLPALFRGVHGAAADLNLWTHDTLGSYNGEQIGQRKQRSYLWKNGSIFAEAHRLLRSGVVADYDDNSPEEPALTVNVASLSFTQVNLVILIATAILCGSYLLVMPRGANRTPWSDAIEGAMLMILIITYTPLSFTYNNSWLMLPIVVVLYFICCKARSATEKRLAVAWLAIALLLLIFTAGKIPFFRYMRSLGNTFWCCMLLYAELIWIMLQARRESNVLQPEQSV